MLFGANFELIAQNKDLADEIESSLINDVLDAWYPKIVDSVYGGFLTNFNFKWEPEEEQNKMLVYQARQVWATSKLAEYFDNRNFKEYADHGYAFLKSKMWDNKQGGFFLETDRGGNKNNKANKTTYSNSFAIYALAAYYKISKDLTALDLAQQTFYWIEKHAHDSINNGYFDILGFDGNSPSNIKVKNGSRYNALPNWKDQNSSIHILEAFTELYSVWPNELLKKRLSEMLNIVRDVITTPKGHLTLFLSEDWKPISFKDSSNSVRNANTFLDHVSFGHDVETAFLMSEASHILGIKNDEKTISMAKRMVDHAIKYGWDSKSGGFYYEGYYFNGITDPKIIDSSKVWWVQAEGLNTFLLFSRLFPSEEKYYNNFLSQWNYIKEYLVDKENKGWFINGLDSDPDVTSKPKAFKWKANYHNIRSLINCLMILRDEEENHQ